MEQREKMITSVTITGTIVNIILTVGKIVAAILGHSAAMLADGLHSLSDFISDIVVLVCVRISAKGSDEDHKYGHGKFETLATLCVSILLFIVGLRLLISGGTDIWDFCHGKRIEAPGTIALWAALISIVSKELLYQYTAFVGRKINSPVVTANAWHHRTDAFSSVGSALGIGGAILFGESWTILDPVACCIISIFILVISLQMALPALNEFLEASLPRKTEEEICTIAASVEGVDDVHGLKTRQNGPYIIIEAHIVASPDISLQAAHSIATEVEQRLRRRFGSGTHISLHMEPSEDAE